MTDLKGKKIGRSTGSASTPDHWCRVASGMGRAASCVVLILILTGMLGPKPSSMPRTGFPLPEFGRVVD